MAKSSKQLYLFTSKFPFGDKSEPFLETEIKYLSEFFQEVHIVPLQIEDGIRPVPDNTYVEKWFDNFQPSKKNKVQVLLSRPFFVFSILINELFHTSLFAFFHSIRSRLDYIAFQMLSSIILRKQFNDINSEKQIILYSYWFCDFPLSIIFANKKTLNAPLVIRAHGYDLYDQRWPYGVPFRNYTIRNSTNICLISNHGLKYLMSRTPTKCHKKFFISRLGVERPHYQNKEAPAFKRLISCSAVSKLKNVNEIPKLLAYLSDKIEWIHFGDGEEMGNLRRSINDLPKNISVKLYGHISNSTLINFYKENHVDLFLSTSSSEGLPVSMMEAQSFGIPIVSYPVGGVPEIVVEKVTGLLLQSDISIAQNAAVIKTALEYPFDRKRIVQYFLEHFCAENNYKTFVSTIQAIKIEE